MVINDGVYIFYDQDPVYLVGDFNLPLWKIWIRKYESHLGWFFHKMFKSSSKPPIGVIGCDRWNIVDFLGFFTTVMLHEWHSNDKPRREKKCTPVTKNSTGKPTKFGHEKRAGETMGVRYRQQGIYPRSGLLVFSWSPFHEFFSYGSQNIKAINDHNITDSWIKHCFFSHPSGKRPSRLETESTVGFVIRTWRTDGKETRKATLNRQRWLVESNWYGYSYNKDIWYKYLGSIQLYMCKTVWNKDLYWIYLPLNGFTHQLMAMWIPSWRSPIWPMGQERTWWKPTFGWTYTTIIKHHKTYTWSSQIVG